MGRDEEGEAVSGLSCLLWLSHTAVEVTHPLSCAESNTRTLLLFYYCPPPCSETLLRTIGSITS